VHDPRNIQLGQLAIAQGLLNQDQARVCLEEATRRRARLSDAALHFGFLTPSQAEALLASLVTALPHPPTQPQSARRAQAQTPSAGDRTVIAGDRTVIAGDRTVIAGDRTVIAPTHREVPSSSSAGDRTVIAGSLRASPSSSAGDRTVIAGSHRANSSGANVPLLDSAGGGGGSSMLPSIGGMIGEYRVIRELGRGGMGAVYQGRKGDTDFAIKVIITDSESATARFEREAQAVAAVDRHPNIVKIHAYSRHGALPYLVLDFIPGASLDTLLEPGLPYELDRSLEILIKTAEAMQFCHDRSILHRDLKPANIMIREEDGEPLLTDFGLAKGGDSEALTKSTDILGTPAYMSPEQAGSENDKIGTASDSWAFGVMLYELATGQKPFPGETMFAIAKKVMFHDPIPPRQHVPELSKDIETIILKCLNKEIEDRYESCGAFAEDCRRARRGDPIVGRRLDPWTRFWKNLRRRHGPHAPKLFIAFLLALLLCIPVIGYFAYFRDYWAHRAEVTETWNKKLSALLQRIEEQAGNSEQGLLSDQGFGEFWALQIAKDALPPLALKGLKSALTESKPGKARYHWDGTDSIQFQGPFELRKGSTVQLPGSPKWYRVLELIKESTETAGGRGKGQLQIELPIGERAPSGTGLRFRPTRPETAAWNASFALSRLARQRKRIADAAALLGEYRKTLNAAKSDPSYDAKGDSKPGAIAASLSGAFPEGDRLALAIRLGLSRLQQVAAGSSEVEAARPLRLKGSLAVLLSLQNRIRKAGAGSWAGIQSFPAPDKKAKAGRSLPAEEPGAMAGLCARVVVAIRKGNFTGSREFYRSGGGGLRSFVIDGLGLKTAEGLDTHTPGSLVQLLRATREGKRLWEQLSAETRLRRTESVSGANRTAFEKALRGVFLENTPEQRRLVRRIFDLRAEARLRALIRTGAPRKDLAFAARAASDIYRMRFRGLDVGQMSLSEAALTTIAKLSSQQVSEVKSAGQDLGGGQLLAMERMLHILDHLKTLNPQFDPTTQKYPDPDASIRDVLIQASFGGFKPGREEERNEATEAARKARAIRRAVRLAYIASRVGYYVGDELRRDVLREAFMAGVFDEIIEQNPLDPVARFWRIFVVRYVDQADDEVLDENELRAIEEDIPLVDILKLPPAIRGLYFVHRSMCFRKKYRKDPAKLRSLALEAREAVTKYFHPEPYSYWREVVSAEVRAVDADRENPGLAPEDRKQREKSALLRIRAAYKSMFLAFADRAARSEKIEKSEEELKRGCPPGTSLHILIASEYRRIKARSIQNLAVTLSSMGLHKESIKLAMESVEIYPHRDSQPPLIIKGFLTLGNPEGAKRALAQLTALIEAKPRNATNRKPRRDFTNGLKKAEGLIADWEKRHKGE